MEKGKRITMDLNKYEKIMKFKEIFDELKGNIKAFSLYLSPYCPYNEWSHIDLTNTLDKDELNEKVSLKVDELESQISDLNKVNYESYQLRKRLAKVPNWVKKWYNI